MDKFNRQIHGYLLFSPLTLPETDNGNDDADCPPGQLCSLGGLINDHLNPSISAPSGFVGYTPELAKSAAERYLAAHTIYNHFFKGFFPTSKDNPLVPIPEHDSQYDRLFNLENFHFNLPSDDDQNHHTGNKDGICDSDEDCITFECHEGNCVNPIIDITDNNNNNNNNGNNNNNNNNDNDQDNNDNSLSNPFLDSLTCKDLPEHNNYGADNPNPCKDVSLQCLVEYNGIITQGDDCGGQLYNKQHKLLTNDITGPRAKSYRYLAYCDDTCLADSDALVCAKTIEDDFYYALRGIYDDLSCDLVKFNDGDRVVSLGLGKDDKYGVEFGCGNLCGLTTVGDYDFDCDSLKFNADETKIGFGDFTYVCGDDGCTYNSYLTLKDADDLFTSYKYCIYSCGVNPVQEYCAFSSN